MDSIGQFSHAVAALAFAFLGVALLWKRSPTGVRLASALASLLTAFWALGQMLAGHYGVEFFPWASRLETLRTAAWVGVLLLLQRRSLGLISSPQQSFVIAVSLGFIVALQIALDILFQFGTDMRPLATLPAGALLFVATRLVLAISGLVLLHNLYVNSGNDGGLSFRMLAVGLAAIFAYDLNLYTLHFLFGSPNVMLLEMRGAVDALATPLLYLALRQEQGGRFQLSRIAAFQTVGFSMIGVYLILMSLVAYGLKMTGGDWGTLLQVIFLAVAVIAGAMVVLSPRFRAEMKVRIARNFYRYRHDYRVEWLRFIDKIDTDSDTGGDAPFRERLIEAVATVFDSPGGVLLERGEDGNYEQSERRGWPDLVVPYIRGDAEIVAFLRGTGRIVEFDQLRAEAENRGRMAAQSHENLRLPDWAEDRSIWLGIPLVHRDELISILLLQRSLASRDLNWEDFDLLRTLGRQGASYLAEAETQARLDEARNFDEYNRRFAFVMHDVKNVVSQLALVARNAERHADNPEFRADMIATINSSVAKMGDLLKLMRHERGANSAVMGDGVSEVDVAQLMSVVAVSLRRQHANLELDGPASGVVVLGNRSRLEAMLSHLLQNAIDASQAHMPIRLTIEQQEGEVCIRIIDHGKGMSRDFIRDGLFRPFRSTKEDGFGIGVFEAREIIRAHRGRLSVESAPGKGSTFTIILPGMPDSAGKQRDRIQHA